MIRDHLILLAAVFITGPAGANDDTGTGTLAQEFDSNAVLVCPDGSPGECDSEDMLNAVEFDADYAAAIETRCLYRTKAPCRPISAGRIFGARQGKPLTWQYMVLSPSDGPLTHMLVIAEGGESEVPYVLAARQTEGWFAPPTLVENGTEGMLIHAPGRRPESVSGRADIVLSRHSQGWTTFSIPDLLAEAQSLMPPGFTLAQVAQVDLSAMIMNVPASRADDSACCPTGGMATIILDMPEANMIRVSHVAFIETNPDATWLVKPAVAPDLGED